MQPPDEMRMVDRANQRDRTAIERAARALRALTSD
jgi:hypothetical protein